MYGLWVNAFALLTVVAVQTVHGEAVEKKDRIDATFISLPINSKFWNPQLDDKTNMELIGIQYLDDSNKTVVEIVDKSAHLGGRDDGKAPAGRPRRGDKFFVWGLLNLLRPWSGGVPEGNLRANSKSPGDNVN